jgi:hypothetical protein
MLNCAASRLWLQLSVTPTKCAGSPLSLALQAAHCGRPQNQGLQKALPASRKTKCSLLLCARDALALADFPNLWLLPGKGLA